MNLSTIKPLSLLVIPRALRKRLPEIWYTLFSEERENATQMSRFIFVGMKMEHGRLLRLLQMVCWKMEADCRLGIPYYIRFLTVIYYCSTKLALNHPNGGAC